MREGKPAVSQALFSANGSGRALFERNSTLEHKKNTLRSFLLSEGEEKSAHTVPRTPQLLLRTAPASFHTAQPIQSIAPFLCHLYPDCPTKPKKETHHIAIFPTHISFFHIFAYTFPNCIPTLLLILFRLNLETTQKNGFRRTQFGEIRIKP